MYAKVISSGLWGTEGYLATVEVDIAKTMPGFDMVGMLAKEVKEARERVRVALRNSGIKLPPVHITVNIAPANLRKDGTGYDLPIALGILAALGYIPQERLTNICVVGELGLAGELKPVRGILPMVKRAKEEHLKSCILPYENKKEGVVTPDIGILGARSLNEVVELLNNAEKMKNEEEFFDFHLLDAKQEKKGEDFSDVRGQEICKRAALIAAAGFHNLLLMGQPGAGKTMIAKRLPGIMPPLSGEEMLAVSSIYSVCGKLSNTVPLIRERPFMAPHHTTTAKTLSGGGTIPMPGIISQAHKGILFLDELPEFSRECIEVLRQPLEEKEIHISRNSGNFSFPADFMLVASCNLCPCGFYPDKNRCRCTSHQIQRYMAKVSGPIADRIDLCVVADKIKVEELLKTETKSAVSNNQYTSEHMQQQVMKARVLQKKRFGDSKIQFNGNIPVNKMETYCSLEKREKEYVKEAMEGLQISARSYHKILRVARTIADLEGEEKIHIKHLAEALCFRMQVEET